MSHELTPSQLRLIEFANEIQQSPRGADDLCFMGRELVQCNLPHRSPGKITAWTRKNGNLTLTIRPGYDHERGEPLGYPFGTIPRLLLFWISTEVVRKKSRRLELGNSLAQFMREVGLNPASGGSIRSDAARLREQMKRLFRATISFDRTIEEDARSGHEWLDMQIAPKAQLWWSTNSPNQETLFGSYVELGEAFFEALINNPVPIDIRAIRALRQSPLALDLYAFLTYREFRAQRSGRDAFIPWRSLHQQVGSNYADVKGFKRRAKSAIEKINTLLANESFHAIDGGLKIEVAGN